MAEHGNPYIIKEPIPGDAPFFGRQEIIQAVEETLREPSYNSIILYGQRRVGKTSLLLQLQKRLPDPAFFPVYFDLAGKAMLSVGQVLYEIAAVAATRAGIAPPPAETFEFNPSTFHETFLPRLYRALGTIQRPVFLLDEFEMVDIPELDLPDYLAVRSLDTYLLWLLSAHHRAAFVFTAGRRMSELDTVRQSDYRADLTQLLTVLTPAQARVLITQQHAPEYEAAAVDQIINIAGGHPAFIQQICHALVEKRAAAGLTQGRIIRQDVADVLPELLGSDPDNEDLIAIWNSLPPSGRLVLAAVATGTDRAGATLSSAEIEQRLLAAEVPADIVAGLAQTPADLVNWQLLQEQNDGYAFEIDYVRRWVAQQRPLARIAPVELGHLDPRPAALYRAAKRSLAQKKVSQALNQLNRALDIDPNYIPALFLRGSILEEHGDREAAVSSYERAYKLSPLVIAGALAAALLKLGSGYEEADKTGKAIAAYERVLQIEPKNETARQRLDTLRTTAKRKAEPRPGPPRPAATGMPDLRRAILLVGALLLLILCLLGWVNGWLGLPSATTDQALAQLTETAGAEPAQAATNTPVETAQPATATTAATVSISQPTETAPPPTAVPPPTATPRATATPQVIASQGETPTGAINIRVPGQRRPLFEALARIFAERQPETEITIETAGSQEGLAALAEGSTDLALVSRNLDGAALAELNNAQLYPLSPVEPVAVISHPSVGLSTLTVDQVRDIFSGAVTNWRELDGPDAEIVPVLPPPGSDTRLALEQQILGEVALVSGEPVIETATEEEVIGVVNSRPYAVGLALAASVPADPLAQISLQTANWAVIDTMLTQAAPLRIGGAAPTVANALDGSYPLVRPLNLVVAESPAPAAEAMVEFILSPEGQQIIDSFQEATP